MFPVDTIPGILLGSRLQRYLCTYRLFCFRNKCQQAFWHHCWGTITELFSNLVALVSLYFYFSSFLSLVPWSKNLSKASPLQRASSLNYHHLQTQFSHEFCPSFIDMVWDQSFFGLDHEKFIPPYVRVWTIVLVLDDFRHDRGNSKIEVVPILCHREGRSNGTLIP